MTGSRSSSRTGRSTLSTSILHYNDDSLAEDARGLSRKAMAAFGGIAPNYHIELLYRPTIYWDFHSLLLGIKIMFSFMLVDDDQPLRLCKHCQKMFLGSRSNASFSGQVGFALCTNPDFVRDHTKSTWPTADEKYLAAVYLFRLQMPKPAPSRRQPETKV